MLRIKNVLMLFERGKLSRSLKFEKPFASQKL